MPSPNKGIKQPDRRVTVDLRDRDILEIIIGREGGGRGF